MKKSTLSNQEFNPFYGKYIDLVNKDQELIEALKVGGERFREFLKKIPENALKTAYAEGKWTILEVIQHCMDTERIFNYRALCISRGDTTAFPGFEQDEYVNSSNANSRKLSSLLQEYDAVRAATLALFENLTAEELQRCGNSSNSTLSARAAGFIIAGHERHHEEIIKERYL